LDVQYYELPNQALASITLLKDPQTNKTALMNMCISFSDYKSYDNGTIVVDTGSTFSEYASILI
jgi:hypothetical protein